MNQRGRRRLVVAATGLCAIGLIAAVATSVTSGQLDVGLSLTPGRTATRVSPRPSPPSDRGAADAARATGWAILTPRSPASRYWAAHGIGTVDDAVRCETALRVQFVTGYRGTSVDGKRALWQAECGGVSDATRDSMVLAAVEWSATHQNGDEGG